MLRWLAVREKLVRAGPHWFTATNAYRPEDGAGHVQPALVHQTGTPLRAAPRDRPDQGVQRRGDQAVAACRRPAAVSCGHAGAHRREADAEALPGAEVGGRPRDADARRLGAAVSRPAASNVQGSGLRAQGSGARGSGAQGQLAGVGAAKKARHPPTGWPEAEGRQDVRGDLVWPPVWRWQSSPPPCPRWCRSLGRRRPGPPRGSPTATGRRSDPPGRHGRHHGRRLGGGCCRCQGGTGRARRHRFDSARLVERRAHAGPVPRRQHPGRGPRSRVLAGRKGGEDGRWRPGDLHRPSGRGLLAERLASCRICLPRRAGSHPGEGRRAGESHGQAGQGRRADGPRVRRGWRPCDGGLHFGVSNTEGRRPRVERLPRRPATDQRPGDLPGLGPRRGRLSGERVVRGNSRSTATSRGRRGTCQPTIPAWPPSTPHARWR